MGLTTIQHASCAPNRGTSRFHSSVSIRCVIWMILVGAPTSHTTPARGKTRNGESPLARPVAGPMERFASIETISARAVGVAHWIRNPAKAHRISALAFLTLPAAFRSAVPKNTGPGYHGWSAARTRWTITAKAVVEASGMDQAEFPPAALYLYLSLEEAQG